MSDPLMRAAPPVARDIGGLFAAPTPVAPPLVALAAEDPPKPIVPSVAQIDKRQERGQHPN